MIFNCIDDFPRDSILNFREIHTVQVVHNSTPVHTDYECIIFDVRFAKVIMVAKQKKHQSRANPSDTIASFPPILNQHAFPGKYYTFEKQYRFEPLRAVLQPADNRPYKRTHINPHSEFNYHSSCFLPYSSTDDLERYVQGRIGCCISKRGLKLGLFKIYYLDGCVTQ